MTNTYNICDKGTCQEPPVYLKAAILKQYPSERADGQYKKCIPGSKVALKQKSKK